VLILAPDRLARHYAYQYVVLEELERAGCAVVFVNGPGGSTPEERLVREVHGRFAESERAAFEERGRRGKLHAARAGRFFSGAGAYGYTYIPSDGHGGTCVVNEAEAAVVRQVFAWLVEDQLSVAAIARRLTERAVPTRYGRPAWAPATVYKLLTNRLYTGEHYYNRTENVPEEVGERARPSQRARWYRQPPKAPRRRLRPVGEWIPIPWPAIIAGETFAMAERQLRLNRLRALIRNGRNLGTPYVISETGTYNTGSDWAPDPRNLTEAGYAECLDVIGELVEEAAKHDAVFCVETYVNNVIGTIDATLRLFRDVNSPNLGLVMDPTNYFEDHNIDDMDGVLRRMFAELGPFIKIAHAKDVARGSDTSVKHADTGAAEYLSFRGVGAMIEVGA
jgi:hypothetical protein